MFSPTLIMAGWPFMTLSLGLERTSTCPCSFMASMRTLKLIGFMVINRWVSIEPLVLMVSVSEAPTTVIELLGPVTVAPLPSIVIELSGPVVDTPALLVVVVLSPLSPASGRSMPGSKLAPMEVLSKELQSSPVVLSSDRVTSMILASIDTWRKSSPFRLLI